MTALKVHLVSPATSGSSASVISPFVVPSELVVSSASSVSAAYETELKLCFKVDMSIVSKLITTAINFVFFFCLSVHCNVRMILSSRVEIDTKPARRLDHQPWKVWSFTKNNFDDHLTQKLTFVETETHRPEASAKAHGWLSQERAWMHNNKSTSIT